jgi:hypothetical protein
MIKTIFGRSGFLAAKPDKTDNASMPVVAEIILLII